MKLVFSTRYYLCGSEWPIDVWQTGLRKWEARGRFKDHNIVAKSNGSNGAVSKWEAQARAIARIVYDL